MTDHHISDWRHSGACTTTDPELFFLDVGQNAGPAKKICRSCPVLEPCLRFALARPALDGVWGGTTPQERRLLRGQKPLQRHANCGTANGYRAHQENKTAVCDPCREAHRVYRADQRKRAA